MPLMRLATVFAPILCCPLAWAMEPAGTTPLQLKLGGAYLSDDLRVASGENWGYYAGLSTLIAESGIFGVPSADIDVRSLNTGDAELLSIEVSYAERALVGDRYWLGFGVGSNWTKLGLSPVGVPAREERRWAIGGKAMIGYLLTNRLFIESTYHYSGKALDLDTSSVSLALGYWF